MAAAATNPSLACTDVGGEGRARRVPRTRLSAHGRRSGARRGARLPAADRQRSRHARSRAHQRHLRPVGRAADLRRSRVVRSDAGHHSVARPVLARLARRAHVDVHPAQGCSLPPRPRGHGRRRRVLADALARPAPEIGDDRPLRQHPRHRRVPLRALAARARDRPDGEPRLLRRSAAALASRLPDLPGRPARPRVRGIPEGRARGHVATDARLPPGRDGRPSRLRTASAVQRAVLRLQHSDQAARRPPRPPGDPRRHRSRGDHRGDPPRQAHGGARGGPAGHARLQSRAGRARLRPTPRARVAHRGRLSGRPRAAEDRDLVQRDQRRDPARARADPPLAGRRRHPGRVQVPHGLARILQGADRGPAARLPLRVVRRRPRPGQLPDQALPLEEPAQLRALPQPRRRRAAGHRAYDARPAAPRGALPPRGAGDHGRRGDRSRLALQLRAAVPAVGAVGRGQRARRSVHPDAEGVAGAMIRPRLRTLRARLLWGAVLVITPTMTGVFLLVERHQRAAIVEEMERRGDVMARSLAAVSQGPLLLYNFTALEQNVARAAGEPDVVYAIVLDAEGKVAAHSRSPDRVGHVLKSKVDLEAAHTMVPVMQETSAARQSVLDFAVPILVTGQKWGTVRVGVSKKRMQAEIVRTRSELAALTLVMLLFGGVSAAFIARRISRPVQQLAEGAAAIARGELNQRIEPPTDDEIGRLAAAFNHMVAELAQQRVALEDANTELRRGFEQLADLKTYTDNILASLTTGIVTVDLDGRVVTLNPAAELMTGFFAGEVRGRYCTEVFAHTPDLAELLMETLAR